MPAIALLAGLIFSVPSFFGRAAAQEALPSGLNRDFGSAGFLSDVIVKDQFTGLALGGIDPLSYFIDGAPGLGKPKYDLTFAGALWWFANIGNRAAFLDAPDIYRPQFGGYGAMAVARGHLAEGRPQIWLLQDDQVFLFYSHANRVAWQQNPKELAEAARRQWPLLSRQLVP
uniref:YHS domain-containing (seleno)protein n=1 Tax=Pararhizobium sp. IMCC3301 TaxID=3067904 RepID=UPI002742949D|nr:YHS domain-containing (seleno)protein [Pararhizobium sp. IMCC3301]